MIGLDTNILVHAVREELPYHAEARTLLSQLATGDDPWAIPWPCVYEFLRVVTHPRIFHPPSPLEPTVDTLQALFASPSLHLLGNGLLHVGHWRQCMIEGRAVGRMAHDAHIAALALEHGVRELWTRDRDFRRFPGLRVRDPFANPP
ncbi:MAG: TA system VapC family ribonuclease toxin [Gemmatimonadales bacterium]